MIYQLFSLGFIKDLYLEIGVQHFARWNLVIEVILLIIAKFPHMPHYEHQHVTHDCRDANNKQK